MSERIKFGRPQTFEQAMLRLPNTDHPEYNMTGGEIEHLANLKEKLSRILSLEQSGFVYESLEARHIPLSLPDIKLLETVSFRRDRDKEVTVDWAKVDTESRWAEVLPFDLENYRTWYICELEPPLQDSRYELVMVLSGEILEDGEVDLFLVEKEELADFVEMLSGNISQE